MYSYIYCIVPFCNHCPGIDLDHPADVQLHAWGTSLQHAFENIIPCMFNYMTDLSKVAIDENCAEIVSISGLNWSLAVIYVMYCHI